MSSTGVKLRSRRIGRLRVALDVHQREGTLSVLISDAVSLVVLGDYILDQTIAIDRVEGPELAYRANASRNEAAPSNEEHWNDIFVAAAQELRFCHNLELTRIRCDAHSGNLIIRGQVSSY